MAMRAELRLGLRAPPDREELQGQRVDARRQRRAGDTGGPARLQSLKVGGWGGASV